MRGGAVSLLENLCNKHAYTRVIVDLTGQNGKHYDTKPKVANGCWKHKSEKRAHRHR
jgi:hypothetical protein